MDGVNDLLTEWAIDRKGGRPTMTEKSEEGIICFYKKKKRVCKYVISLRFYTHI